MSVLKEISFRYTEYECFELLPERVKPLMQLAIEIREGAYAPYSKFKVGAAVLLSNGKIITGSNQENAAFPSGLCAERVAIYQASALYPNEKMQAIAISGTGVMPTGIPVSPCGACRQSMLEYEMRQRASISVYFMGALGKIIKVNSISDLLPFFFDGSLI